MQRFLLKICAVFLLLLAIPCFASAAIKEGEKGYQVALIQMKLQDSNYTVGAVDGRFNNNTTQALRAFQTKNHLKSDGVVDEKTYQVLLGKKTPQPAALKSKPYKIADKSLSYIGVPYKFGGQTPQAFDCSGFVQYVFKEQGTPLPRPADEQYKVGKSVLRGNLSVGDMVFFTTYEKGASHVGIYLGEGRFIHASSSRGVMVSHLAEDYWKTRYLGARRVL